jgi:hypothetical protein
MEHLLEYVSELHDDLLFHVIGEMVPDGSG